MHRLSSIYRQCQLLGVATKLSTDEDVSDNVDAVSTMTAVSYYDVSRRSCVAVKRLFFDSVTFLPTAFFFQESLLCQFTCGSVLFMGSFAMLVGPSKYLKTIFSRERMSFSGLFGSLLMTLYSVFVARSYLYTMFSAFAQISSLLQYASSYIPGGKYAMAAFSRMFFATVRMILGPCLKCCGKSVGRMFVRFISSSLPF